MDVYSLKKSANCPSPLPPLDFQFPSMVGVRVFLWITHFTLYPEQKKCVTCKEVCTNCIMQHRQWQCYQDITNKRDRQFVLDYTECFQSSDGLFYKNAQISYCLSFLYISFRELFLSTFPWWNKKVSSVKQKILCNSESTICHYCIIWLKGVVKLRFPCQVDIWGAPTPSLWDEVEGPIWGDWN